jgi:hypothetical protein
MEPTESQLEAFTILVEHYGDIDSWKTNHWKNYNEMLRVRDKAWLSEYDLNNNGSYTVYKKERERLLPLHNGTLKLIYTGKKVLRTEDLEPSEKLLLVDKVIDDMNDSFLECKKSTYEYVRLMKEFRILEKDGLVNPEIFNRKKPVGRPKSKIIYQWMDYLVSELGTRQKAADYASDFPMTDSKKTDTLKREYRKYCKAKDKDKAKAKGEG